MQICEVRQALRSDMMCISSQKWFGFLLLAEMTEKNGPRWTLNYASAHGRTGPFVCVISGFIEILRLTEL
jgi:hypothetical protein